MVAIPLPLSSAPGFREQEGAGRLINLFAEPLGEGRNDGAKRVRVPGMTSFLTSSQTGFRGMMLVGPTLYAAFNGQLMRGSSAGGPMGPHATLAGTLPVYFARNNAGTPDKVVVTENGVFLIVDPATISPYPDPGGVLPAANAVCQLDGYFVFTIGNGRMYASDLNVTSLNALSFGSTDVKPDKPIRPIPFAGRLMVFGEQSTEIWTDVGAVPFPFQRSSVLPVGLIGPDAVAGWEDGFAAGLLWVGDDGTVRMLDGYTPTKVSPPDLDRLIQRDTNKSRMLASVYMVDGHPMWTITGETFSWSFDIGLKKWHERHSYLTNRWRGLQTVSAFGRWLAGDRKTGNLYTVDPTNFREGTEQMRARIESGPVEGFPQRVRVARADFKIETGVGVAQAPSPSVAVYGAVAGTSNRVRLTVLSTDDMLSGDTVRVANVVGTIEANGSWPISIVDLTHIELIGPVFANAYVSGGTVTPLTPRDPTQTDPTIAISWSDDGGATWSLPLLRKMGQMARYEKNITVTRTGMSTRFGRRWRLDIADPVYVAIFTGDQSAELRTP